MMEWIPATFIAFKALVLGIGMYFAIKWHYDQGKKKEDVAQERRAVVRAGGKAIAIFVCVLLVVGGVTFFFVKMLGLNLNYP